MIKKVLVTLVVLFVALISFQYLNTGSPNDVEQKNNFEIIAHRGVHQHYANEGKDVRKSNGKIIWGCDAKEMQKPTHKFIENTVEAIQAAFNYGATIVEFDIRPTKDDELVVFHDDNLECKTNGKGKVSDFTVAELKKLDVGYGYTYDNGQTFPFRGKGVAGIKTLTEVLQHFPDKKFLIDNKNGNSLKVAQLLVNVLATLPETQRKNIYLWTEDKAYQYMHEKLTSVKRLLLPREEEKKFFKSYIFSLGLIGVPKEYKGEGLGIPLKYIKYLWGWPYRFLDRLDKTGARFYLYVNNQSEYDSVSGLPLNGIVTDYIEEINVSKRSHS
jgi:glycerophosphoryl diester phosphodiesterase